MQSYDHDLYGLIHKQGPELSGEIINLGFYGGGRGLYHPSCYLIYERRRLLTLRIARMQ